MMQGYASSARRPPARARLRYHVIWRDGGWCVAVNGCATRPFADRARADAVATALQAEADGLRHLPPWQGETQ